MKVVLDPTHCTETAKPLRAATEIAREVRLGTRGLAGHADHTGHDELDSAVDDFLQAWGMSLESIAGHGETLARMLDLAGSCHADQPRSPVGGLS